MSIVAGTGGKFVASKINLQQAMQETNGYKQMGNIQFKVSMAVRKWKPMAMVERYMEYNERAKT